MFMMIGAPWQQLVDALLSNTSERSDTVSLVFERELDSTTANDAPSEASS